MRTQLGIASALSFAFQLLILVKLILVVQGVVGVDCSGTPVDAVCCASLTRVHTYLSTSQIEFTLTSHHRIEFSCIVASLSNSISASLTLPIFHFEFHN
jgi:hypothetical protein